MKRLLITAFCLTAMVVSSFAQSKAEKELQFIYISHDEETPVQLLLERLNDAYKDARNYPDAREVIFYLANSTEPKIVQVNTNHDNQKDYDKIAEELQTTISHNIEPAIDRERIVQLFNENDILDENGNPVYAAVEWTYYVNNTFWSLGNNEEIISALYFIMDMDSMVKSHYLRINIMYPSEMQIDYDKKLPFGTKGLFDKSRFMLIPY